MLDQLPFDILFLIIHYLSARDRFYLRKVSWYFYEKAWLPDELEYFNCPNRDINSDLCLRQGHLNCVRFMDMAGKNKIHKAIIYGVENVFRYYLPKISIDNGLYQTIINDSNERALILISSDPYLKGRFSFKIESAISNSTVSFIMLIIQIYYNNDKGIFLEEFAGDIEASGRIDLFEKLKVE